MESSTHLVAQSIGQVLLELGAITPEDLNEALKLQKSGSEAPSIDHILIDLGLISERQLAEALSRLYSLPILESKEIPTRPILADKITREFLVDAQILPVRNDTDSLTVAVANPEDSQSIKALRLASGKSIQLKIASAEEISTALHRLYESDQSEFKEIVSGIGEPDAMEENQNLEQLKSLASEGPVIRLVNLIISRAAETRASDIHIEPFQDSLQVRYRIDGVLRETDSPPARLAPAIVSRIKIMAGLDIAERRLSQDGRVRVPWRKGEIDLRISTVPSLHGESIVIRLLQHEEVTLNLKTLGFGDKERNLIEILQKRPNGIVISTGPTGSGKTTSLYTILKGINSKERKIITVEDPIEYQIPGILQIQVKPDIGLSFANILRSIVRHDPDVIMVGEIRDRETAEIAIQSALTGHMVLSTLHTNDAASAITRLLDMQVEAFLLTSTINAIVGQRLVRKLCSNCTEPYRPNHLLESERQTFVTMVGDDDFLLYHPVGCKVCEGIGYVGRVGIFELLTLSEDIHELVLDGADANAIKRKACELGMTTMHEDGLSKAFAGLTSIEEVRRVAQES